MIVLALIGSLFAVDSGNSVERLFLMLNDRQITFSDDYPVVGTSTHLWDPVLRQDFEVVDGVEFRFSREFWRMIKANDEKFSVKNMIMIDKNGTFLFDGKKVDLGTKVVFVHNALRWGHKVVGVVGVDEPGSVKGPPSHLIWFDTTTLKGSHLRLDFVGPPPLRIYRTIERNASP